MYKIQHNHEKSVSIDVQMIAGVREARRVVTLGSNIIRTHKFPISVLVLISDRNPIGCLNLRCSALMSPPSRRSRKSQRVR